MGSVKWLFLALVGALCIGSTVTVLAVVYYRTTVTVDSTEIREILREHDRRNSAQYGHLKSMIEEQTSCRIAGTTY